MLVASALTAVGALIGMYVLSQMFQGLRVEPREYLSARCGLGDLIVAVNTEKALPWAMIALVAPLALLTTVSLGLFLSYAGRLLQRARPHT